MRPRQSSLGNRVSSRSTLPLPNCSFNEAEAIKPRKPGHDRHVVIQHRPRFNEAEAIKPRKPVKDRDMSSTVSQSASMRPRQSSLGNRPSWKVAGSKPLWACFNEAEAIKPRKPLRASGEPRPRGCFNEAEAGQASETNTAGSRPSTAFLGMNAEAIKPLETPSPSTC